MTSGASHPLESEGSEPSSFRAVVVFIADRLKPDGLSLLRRRNRDVGKRTVRRGGVPMLDPRSAFDYVSLVSDTDWLSPLLVIAGAFGDEKNLATGVNMPVEPCAGAVGCLGDGRVEASVSYNQLAEPDVPGVVLGVGEFAFREGRLSRLRLNLKDEYDACC